MEKPCIAMKNRIKPTKTRRLMMPEAPATARLTTVWLRSAYWESEIIWLTTPITNRQAPILPMVRFDSMVNLTRLPDSYIVAFKG